ncbi:MAG: hypothetical protein C4581_10020 [Nitrospiraceae bacterium]|nr:MAG: hypothetical protein C4581_10020 [Nitrospiraceae bacterium]
MEVMLNRKKYKLTCTGLLLLFALIAVLIVVMQSLVFAVSSINIPEIPPFPAIISTGNTYHVSKDIGSNLNDGSSEHPWKTLQYGVDQVKAGDTLIVHATPAGYNEWVYISNSGTESNWITIKGRDGEDGQKVIITDYELRLKSSAAYISVENINIHGKYWSTLFLNSNTHHLAFNNIEIDCQNSSENYTGVVVHEGVNNVWFRDMYIHNCGYEKLSPTDASGVYMMRHLSTDPLITDIVFMNVTVRDNNGDGISSTAVDSVYFDRCNVTNNTGDGYDIYARTRAVFKDIISAENGEGLRYQGVGIKAWSKETWLINALIYKNYYDGVLFQSVEDNSKFFVLNSTFVDDVFYNRSGYGTNQVYLYNNVFYPLNAYPPTVIFEDISKQTLAGEDNNYYFSDNNAVAFKYKEGGKTRNYTFKEMGDGTWYKSTGYGSKNIGIIGSLDHLPDPGFTDTYNNLFSLKKGSLAIDAGIDLSLIFDNYDKTRICNRNPDIGAIEYCSCPNESIPANSGQLCSDLVLIDRMAPVAPKRLRIL